MDANLTIKGHKVTINGNLVTGDTYPIKSYIKEYLCGKWDGERKGWIVDLGQVENFMRGSYPSIQVVGAQVVASDTPKATRINNGWCNKCHSYCYGDCDSH